MSTPRPTPPAEVDALFGVDIDRTKELLEWLWDRRERIGDVIESVPEILDSVGESLAAAGGGATNAAQLLVGSKEEPGVKALALSAAKALQTCASELDDLGQLLDRLAGTLDAINLPGVGSVFDGAAGQLRDGSGRVGAVSTGLDSVQDTLRRLGGQIDVAAEGIATTGRHLSATGTKLAEVQRITRPERSERVGSIGSLLAKD